jgi:hypothetical protein
MTIGRRVAEGRRKAREVGAVGIWDTLRAALGGGGRGGDGSDRDGLYIYVRCDRCGDVVRVRVNMANELQQEFSEGGGVAGYSLQKGVVDARCFRPIQVSMTFDGGRRELSREIEGGQFVDEEAYEAARGLS